MVPTRVKRCYNTLPKLQPAGFFVQEYLCHKNFLSSGRLGDMKIGLPLRVVEGMVIVVTFPLESSAIMMVWNWSAFEGSGCVTTIPFTDGA